MDKVEFYSQNYIQFKVSQLKTRRVHNRTILPFLNNLPKTFELEEIGRSVQNRAVHSVGFGTGPIKVLIWSQMHGNESTTTKAIIDFCNILSTIADDDDEISLFTFLIIPILNPDGAFNFSRYNQNGVDINRDAKNLTQVESVILKNIFESFKPDYCFNMHEQRSIYSAGECNYPSTMSFLAPSFDENSSINSQRKISMFIINQIYNKLKKFIPNQISRFDETFNMNCFGDLFQSLGVPTVLFEAGYYQNDFKRNVSRKLTTLSLIIACKSILESSQILKIPSEYYKIPENKPLFFDVLIKDALINNNNLDEVHDIGIIFEEITFKDKIKLVPKIKSLGNLNLFFGHRIINAGKSLVTFPKKLKIGLRIEDFSIDNKKIPILPENNLI